MRLIRLLFVVIFAAVCPLAVAAQSAHPLLQRPAFNGKLIAFSYAGDLWTVDSSGGHASRLTTGTGIETDPVFSPDGSMIAFTGEYDGNTDVFVVPATGGVPKRLTYHPAADVAVGWTPDGKDVIFRSNRESSSGRYTKLFKVSVNGGLATALPLPMASFGKFSADGKYFAYSPAGAASGFNYSSYVSWKNYRGGLASSVWIADMATLEVVKVPREKSNDFSPVWVGNQVYFLSDRNGPVSLFSFDPASKSVKEVMKNDGADIRSASGGPGGIVYDRFGELFLYDTASGQTHPVPVDLSADLPDVRARISPVAREIENYAISPTGVRAVFEAHGDILTVPAKESATRDITNTSGVMERDPAWSPDGQSIAYFSDESGQYALHISSQTGAGAVKKFPLANEPTFYFHLVWSPDSKRIAFHDNKMEIWQVEIATGKPAVIDTAVNGDGDFDAAWSPDSKWLAYTQSLANRLHALFLYSVASGKSTQITDGMSDLRFPAFDRGGKYLYFTESTNYGTSTSGLDMSSDEFTVNRSVDGLALAADTPSPIAPQSEDEKGPDAKDKDANDDKDEKGDKGDKDNKDSGDGHGDKDKDKSDAGKKSDETGKPEKAEKAEKPKPVKIDLERIEDRVVALPLPPRSYTDLAAGKEGTLYLLEDGGKVRIRARADVDPLRTEDEKTREAGRAPRRIRSFIRRQEDAAGDGPRRFGRPAGGRSGADVCDRSRRCSRRNRAKANWICRAWKCGWIRAPSGGRCFTRYGRSSAASSTIRTITAWTRWRQEAKYKPYLDQVGSRSDLNYLFQEMLGDFSIGHLRGFGGTIPRPNHVPGGLLGADYEIVDGRYRIKRIYTGEHWNPDAHAPLAEPGLKVATGDFILAIGGEELRGTDDIQRLLEGTAGTQVVLKIAADASGKGAHDVTVTPIGVDLNLRNLAWIEANRHKVQELSGGKLAYVYLPDTAMGGLTNFNRYYFAQLDKQAR
jgi:tricorn protease